MDKIVKYIKNNMPHIAVNKNFDMTNKHTYHIECIAKYYIEINNKKEAINLLSLLDSASIKYIILGGGSNVIFKEKVIKKVVIHFIDGEIVRISHNKIRIFAGTTIGKLLQHCIKNNIGGFEWSAGIPASAGGAVIMNMGAYGSQISEKVFSVIYYYKGKVLKKIVTESDFGYRYSTFKNLRCIVLEVTLCIECEECANIKEKIAKFIHLKRQNQPVTEYSCGSVFKNLEKYSVAKLIDDCSLKGYRKNGAEISTKHSNFIINKNNATFQDIFYIIRHIKKVVQKRYNICIFCEILIQ